MSGKLRLVDAEKVIKVLKRVGFEVRRQKGSHVILKNTSGKVVVIPVHSGEKIGRGLLLKIIRASRNEQRGIFKIA